MQPIKPEIQLFTKDQDTGIHFTSLIMKHRGNKYHLHASTNDAIYIYQESIALYVLTINTEHGTVSLNTYMAPEPDALNTVFLHSIAEIEDVLGDTWEQMTPLAMTKQLINHLI